MSVNAKLSSREASQDASVLAEQNDIALLKKVANADRQAFKILYLAYYHRLYRFVGNMLLQNSYVEEVINDVMLVVWAKASTFQYQSKVSTWILGIAYRKSLKVLKKIGRKESIEQSNDEIENIAEEISPYDGFEMRDLLIKSVNKLPDLHRTVLQLTVMGYSYNEIADITNIPVNTVKSRMFHARNKLRKLIEPQRD